MRSPFHRNPRAAITAGLGVIALATWASAQPKPAPPIRTPGRPVTSGFPSAVPPPPPPTAPFKPQESSTVPAAPPEPITTPRGGVTIGLQDADLPELINWIGSLTGRRFIYGAKVRPLKVTLYSPQPVSVAEAYRAFLVALETNGMTVVPHGRFLKIIDTQGAANQITPVYGPASPVPAEDRYITRMYRLQHVGAEDVSTVLSKFKSKDGDITVYGSGNLLIITDTGSNIRRMMQIVEEVDVGTSGEQLWVEPVHYSTATEISRILNEVLDIKSAAGGAKGAAPAGAASGGGGEARVTKIVPDDRTNSLVIVATDRAYTRILELIKRLDVPKTGEGEIHVLPLQHAQADELAPVLNQIIGGAGATGGAAGAARPPGSPTTPGATPGATGGMNQLPQGILEGGVRITADKATNSIIITSSLRDYAQIRNVIDKLDYPRRQVFIEAVIMDLSIDRSTKIGLNYHGGAAPTTDLPGKAADGNSLIYGGLNPINSIAPPQADQLQGLALGVRGPSLNGTNNLLGTGLSVPAFGVVLNALAQSGDANVLATPHVIATDNVKAEINVGENIPLQTNVGGLSSLAGLAGASGAAGALGSLGALGGLGGGAAPRADVGTHITVTPHMNDSNEVRLDLIEEISERGATSGTLGAVSITKRNATTTVVVRDQQTVVIGGLMRDSLATAQKKVPILGDIPVLGFLFRSTETSIRKTNLLLVLTPYVIRNQDDLRTVFERKMQERQEFLDRYFVFSDQQNYEPPTDYSRLNGLLEDIRQSYLSLDERKRLMEKTAKRPLKTHEPGEPIEMPDIRRPSSSGAHSAGTTPAADGPKDSGTKRPAVLSPGSRSTAPSAPAPAAPKTE